MADPFRHDRQFLGMQSQTATLGIELNDALMDQKQFIFVWVTVPVDLTLADEQA